MMKIANSKNLYFKYFYLTKVAGKKIHLTLTFFLEYLRDGANEV